MGEGGRSQKKKNCETRYTYTSRLLGTAVGENFGREGKGSRVGDAEHKLIQTHSSQPEARIAKGEVPLELQPDKKKDGVKSKAE